MDKLIWAEHLKKWKLFLTEMLSYAQDDGDIIRISRQLQTIEKVRCGAALNPALLLEFINPSDKKLASIEDIDFYLNLNESQKRAVMAALSDNYLSLIQGPPGTGKTQVIAEMCLQLHKQNPNIRILVCSETHVAVNNLIARISSNSEEAIRSIRIRDKENDDEIDEFSIENIVQSYLDWASKSLDNKRAFEIISNELSDTANKSLEKALALSANIIGVTCNRLAAYDFLDSTEMFDIVVIDEVCKATLPEILTPLLISNKAILLGDPQQLPPVFCSEEQEVIKSIEDCDLNRFMYIDTLFRDSLNTTVLDTQYRMTDGIGDMISHVFYNDLLKNGRNEHRENDIVWVDYKPTQEWPMKNTQNDDRVEIYNTDECLIINDLLSDVIANNASDTTVAVITPYKGQVRQLRKQCKYNHRVKIDTVDGFQGKEADIVIFSITRTTGAFRFLADDRRLNVALSRARNQIYIVGDKKYCMKSKLLSSIIDRCNVVMHNYI